MSRFTYQGQFSAVGNKSDPDILYYNASIVNNTTDDTGTGNVVSPDPQIRFIETRDTALIKDASRYQFSIVRFVVNGANKDLPLFIPQIQSGTGQTDVNLTEYGVGISFNFTRTASGFTYAYAPPLTYVEYIPETQNPKLAPQPRQTANPRFVGAFNNLTTYNQGDIVQGIDNQFYSSLINNNLGNSPVLLGGTSPFWTIVSTELGQPQDLSSRYYWVYTYSHWVNLVNTALDNANQAVYNAYVNDFGLGDFATYTAWTQTYPSPVMKYDENTGLFNIYLPDAFRQNTPAPAPPSPTSGTILQNAVMSLYFNSNMEGLFSNFDNIYFNSPIHAPPYDWTYTPVGPTLYPVGYTNYILPNVKGLNDNVFDGSGVLVSGYTGKYVKITQDYESTTTLWSPIDSIVFVSTLLPLMNEQQAPPNNIGAGNIGTNSTSQSAFAPIITDVSLDLSSDGTGYRKMIYYAPNAEYRMADFQNSKQDIRSIDIQVFWKNRLDNQLYPLSMFNLSSVSFKLMFRKKSYKDALGAEKE